MSENNIFSSELIIYIGDYFNSIAIDFKFNFNQSIIALNITFNHLGYIFV